MAAKRLLFIFCWVVCYGCLCSITAQADDLPWVQAKGIATAKGVGTPEARTIAIQDAQRNAVEQAVGTMVSSETLVENYVVIKDKILTRSQGYIRKYDVLSEGQIGDDYEVLIKAQVEEIALADDVIALANVLPRMNYPTVVITFTQKSLSSNLDTVGVDLGTAEQTVVQFLTEKGFRLAEPSALEAEKLRQMAISAATGNTLGQALESASHIAQVMVTGQVVMQDNGASPYNERMHSYGAVLTAKIFETVTGRMIGSVMADANIPGISFTQGASKAAQEAAKKVSQEISSKIVKGWLNACYNEHDVTLIVENISFEALGELQSQLASIPGINRVNRKGFLKGRAEIVIGWRDCDSQKLADKLMSANKKMTIQEVQGNAIRVSYAKKI